MMKQPKHLDEEDLVLIYYREPGVAAEAVSHLSECARCKADFDALAETLNACLDWTPPEPELDFERSVWAQLAPQIVERPKARRWWILAPVLTAAVALLVTGAFVAGRRSRSTNTPTEPVVLTAGLSAAARERILAISMADHLDRAEVLLTGLANADETDSAEFEADRLRARDLVSEGRLLREVAAGQHKATVPVLDEIERLVLEVANAPDHAGPAEIREVKQWIGADSLLFKVRIIETNLRSGRGQKL